MRAAKAVHGRDPRWRKPEWRRVSLSASARRISPLISAATWCEGLRNYRFRIRYSPERTQGMVAWAAFRTFVLDANGDRNFPYLNQNGERWYLNWNWTSNNLNRNGRVASNGRQKIVRNTRRMDFALIFCAASRRAFFRFHQVFQRALHIFYCPEP